MRRVPPKTFLAFVAICVIALAPNATAAGPTVTITSDPFDPIGVGYSSAFNESNGTFEVNGSRGHVGIAYKPNGSTSLSWFFYFTGQYDGPLQPGTYAGAVQQGAGDQPSPTLFVSSPWAYPREATGTFTVLDIAYGPSGTVTSFHATFEQHDRGGESALRGEIDLHGSPSGDPANLPPEAHAGPDQRVSLATGAHLAGTAVDDGQPPPGVVATRWAKFTGPGEVTFGDADALETTAQFSQPGRYGLLLTAKDGAKIGSDTMYVTVLDLPNEPTLHLESDPNELLGHGATFDLDALQGYLRATSESGSGEVVVVFYDPVSLDYWAVDFQGPSSMPLAEKTYTGAVTDPNPLEPTPQPRLSITNKDYVTAEGTGSFTVKKIAYDADGKLAAFWATFEVIESGTGAALRGEVRLRADADLVPVNQSPGANAGPSQRVYLPGRVTLAGIAGDDGLPNGQLTTTWSAVTGPGEVHFENPHAVQTSATFSSLGFYKLRLTSDDGEKQRSSDVEFSILDPEAETSLDLTYEPLVGNEPERRHYSQAEIDFFLDNDDGSVTVHALRDFGYYWLWTFNLNAPYGEKLGVGAFLHPTAPGSSAQKRPYLSFDDDNSFLSGEGDFEVLKLIRGPDGRITSLHVVFAVRYGVGSPLTRGVLKYNAQARVPENRGAPGVTAGFAALGRVREPVPLHGEAVDESLPASALSTIWSVVRGPGLVSIANPHAPRTVAYFSKAGDYLLKLTASDGAQSRSSLLHVSVAGPNDPTRVIIISEPGAWVGDGKTYEFNQLNSHIIMSGEDRGSVGLQVYGNAPEHGHDFAILLGNGKKPLAPGTYRVTKSASIYDTLPAIEISGDSRGYNHFAGTFTVKQIEYIPDGTPARLWATFAIRGDNDRGMLRGEVRVHADGTDDDPPDLFAYAGEDQTVLNRKPLQLQGFATRLGASIGAEYPQPLWIQVSGPADAIIDQPRSLSPTVRFPAAGVYVFDFHVSTSIQSARDQVVIRADQSTMVDRRRYFYQAVVSTATGETVGSADLKVTSSEYFTGQLRLRGQSYVFSGVLDNPWTAIRGTTLACRAYFNSGNLVLELQDGATAYAVTLREAGSGATGESPKALIGTYAFTGALPGDGAANGLGSAWGTLALSAGGRVTARIHLPDGRTAVSSSLISPDGLALLCYYSPDGTCAVAGTVALTGAAPASHLSGTLAWSRRGAAAGRTAALNFSTTLELHGASMRRLPERVEPLTISSAPVAAVLRIETASAGTLTVPLTLQGLSATVRPPADATAALRLDAYGRFTGTFVDPSTQTRVPFEGIVLEGQGFGEGLYYDHGKSGRVRLEVDGSPSGH